LQVPVPAPTVNPPTLALHELGPRCLVGRILLQASQQRHAGLRCESAIHP
jgi:hypothetical protein